MSRLQYQKDPKNIYQTEERIVERKNQIIKRKKGNSFTSSILLFFIICILVLLAWQNNYIPQEIDLSKTPLINSIPFFQKPIQIPNPQKYKFSLFKANQKAIKAFFADLGEKINNSIFKTKSLPPKNKPAKDINWDTAEFSDKPQDQQPNHKEVSPFIQADSKTTSTPTEISAPQEKPVSRQSIFNKTYHEEENSDFTPKSKFHLTSDNPKNSAWNKQTNTAKPFVQYPILSQQQNKHPIIHQKKTEPISKPAITTQGKKIEPAKESPKQEPAPKNKSDKQKGMFSDSWVESPFLSQQPNTPPSLEPSPSFPPYSEITDKLSLPQEQSSQGSLANNLWERFSLAYIKQHSELITYEKNQDKRIIYPVATREFYTPRYPTDQILSIAQEGLKNSGYRNSYTKVNNYNKKGTSLIVATNNRSEVLISLSHIPNEPNSLLWRYDFYSN